MIEDNEPTAPLPPRVRRTRIRLVRLRRWFPPDDPVATAVAMLCVLREDFLLELAGIVDGHCGRLDDNGREFRRIYFWRNTLRTLEEIRTTLNRLNKEREFRAAMDREQPGVREAFEELKRTLNRASQEFLSTLRNELGGHLDEDAMRETLQQIDDDAEGFLEVATARRPVTTAFRFTADLVWAVIGRHAIAKQRDVHALLVKVADLIPTVTAIDHVVACYLHDRGLFRRRE
jgi:hypothetical protein